MKGNKSLDPEKERKILKAVDKKEGEIIEFVKELIGTSSINPPGDEREIADIIAKKVEDLNFVQKEEIAREEHRPNLIYTIRDEKDKIENNKSIFFNGHMDTKPPGDLKQWTIDPFQPEIKEGKLYGLGSSDMKGAIGAMIFAAEVLSEKNLLNCGDLKLLFTADEESGTNFGASYLCKNFTLSADYGLVGEPAGILDSWEKLFIANRKLLGFKIIIEGNQIHSSLSEHLKCINANLRMAEVITKMENQMDFSEFERKSKYSIGITKNIGMHVKGGVNYGVFPGKAEIKSELRVPPGINRDVIFEKIKEFINSLKEDSKDLDIRVKKEVPAASEDLFASGISEEEEFVKIIRGAGEDILKNHLPVDLFPGGTDASKFNKITGIPTLPAVGPGILSVCHQPDEYVKVKDIIKATKLYVLTAARYFANE